MKKIAYAFLAFLFAFGSILLVGCDKEDKFWEETNTIAVEFATKEENAFLLSENGNIEFSPLLATLIEENDNYAEILQYTSLARVFMTMFTKQYVNLSIAPNVTKNTKSLFEAFEDEVQQMQTAINTFQAQKTTFEQRIEIFQDHSSTPALTELDKFKRQITGLVHQTSAFNQSFENLYTNAYLSVPTAPIQLHQVGYENLILSVTVNKILRSHVKFAFDDSTSLIRENVTADYLNTIRTLREKIFANSYKENTIDIINEITEYTKMFDHEIANFELSLSKVNIKEFLQNGEQYLLQNPTLESYIHQINRFNNTVITIYTNKVLELCA